MQDENTFVNLERGRWNLKNHETLEKLIAEYRNTNSYAVFDWDNTSIQGDTQLNLFIYQVENLEYKLTPEKFNEVIRKNVPEDDFNSNYRNEDGEILNARKLSDDIFGVYIYLYENYILNEKIPLKEIKLGEYLGDITVESSEKILGEAGKVVASYDNGLRIRSEIADLFHKLRENGIDVYIVSASMQEVIEVFATDGSYGYNLDIENVYAMRLKVTEEEILLDEYNYDYPLTQRKGKVEAIERFIKPKYNGRGPILVAGDAVGDENMLTEYKDTKVLLLMKREGKLDNLLEDKRALVQNRNLQTGLLSPK